MIRRMVLREQIDRVQGVSGELVLLRGPAGLEIVVNGVFLVSAANSVSSRALVSAAWEHVEGGALEVLIGGLGIGDALDEALGCERVAAVTVVELEPAVVAWFRAHGGESARRVAEAEREGRVRLLVADVAESIERCRGSWDVVALDTDNGPAWLVRHENARLYSRAGLSMTRAALRPGGVACHWTTGDCAGFERELLDVFDELHVTRAVDVVDGRRVSSTIYVARRDEGGWTRGAVDCRDRPA